MPNPPREPLDALLYWDRSDKPEDLSKLATQIEHFANQIDALAKRALERKRHGQGPPDDVVRRFTQSSFTLAGQARNIARCLHEIAAETGLLSRPSTEALTQVLQEIQKLMAPMKQLHAVLSHHEKAITS